MKKILGLTEIVKVHGNDKVVEVAAICDTGATKTSIDKAIADKLSLGPVIGRQRVKNPSFDQKIVRPIVASKIEIKDKVFDVRANIQDRSHMTHKIIIGRDILHNNFIVDVSLSHSGYKVESLKDEETRGFLNSARYVEKE